MLVMLVLFFYDLTIKLTCRYGAQRNSGQVKRLVYARHGHKLMGLKSPAGNPVLSENLT